MKYGNDDQAGQSEIEARRLDQRRRIQLGTMTMGRLRAEHRRTMLAHGIVPDDGRGWKRHDFIDFILGIEQSARVRAAHHRAFGDGHERCPMMNDFPQCPEAIVSRETEGEQS